MTVWKGKKMKEYIIARISCTDSKYGKFGGKYV